MAGVHPRRSPLSLNAGSLGVAVTLPLWGGMLLGAAQAQAKPPPPPQCRPRLRRRHRLDCRVHRRRHCRRWTSPSRWIHRNSGPTGRSQRAVPRSRNRPDPLLGRFTRRPPMARKPSPSPGPPIEPFTLPETDGSGEQPADRGHARRTRIDQPEATPPVAGPGSELIPQPDPATEPRVLISEVVIEGLDGHPEREQLELAAYGALRVTPGTEVTRSELRDDLAAVYDTGWFSDARIEPVDTPLGVRLVVTVAPNPVLTSIRLDPTDAKVPETGGAGHVRRGSRQDPQSQDPAEPDEGSAAVVCRPGLFPGPGHRSWSGQPRW